MKKNYFLLSLVVVVTLFSCGQSEEKTYSQLHGETMGTTYSVTYSASENYQAAIDQLLLEINSEVSTYEPEAVISIFNKGEELTAKAGRLAHFTTNFEKSKAIYETTEGFFDPTVMPLVYYWGFGSNKKAVEEVDAKKIDTLLTYVGFEKVIVQKNEDGSTTYKKANPHTQLDFSAIAKGYAVDKVAELLSSKGVQDYLVEIGGETVTKGKNAQGKVWTIGINTPTTEASPMSDFEALVQLDGKAIATSGNYRNFYEVDGQKYGHTLDPKTGYSAKSNILSASVVANDCMTADGYATAFMAMGVEKAMATAAKIPGLAVFFIYDDNGEMKEMYSDEMKNMIIR